MTLSLRSLFTYRPRRRPARVARTAALTVLTLLLSLFVASGSASAAGECGGSRISTYPIVKSGVKIAQLEIYYSSATGRNCALTRHMGPTAGVYLKTFVSLSSCRETRPGGGTCTSIQHDENEGTFRSYAGPVSVYGKGKCIAAFGWIKASNGVTYTAASTWPGHCG